MPIHLRGTLLTENSPTAFCLIASFCAVAYWMCIELLVLVYVTFKRHSGVYFWSIIITTLGLILQTTGYILKSFENSSSDILTTIICKVGWVANVTGFAVVLWSRLHLVVNNERLLKFVLAVIIVNGVICHTPIIVCEFGLISSNREPYYQVMKVYEKVQQTVFTVQETAISSMYIYFTARFLNIGYAMQTRKVVSLLVAVQVTVVALDILLTVIDFNDMFTLKCTIHPFIYSIKLKLEFIVLNQLQQIVKKGLAPGLNLRTLSSSEESGQSQSNEVSFPKQQPMDFDIAKSPEFITKARLAIPTPSPSTGRSLSESDAIDVESSTPIAKGANATQVSAIDDETDLRNIVGSPDDEFERAVVDDLERRYLGPEKPEWTR